MPSGKEGGGRTSFITRVSGDAIHPQLRCGSGYETIVSIKRYVP